MEDEVHPLRRGVGTSSAPIKHTTKQPAWGNDDDVAEELPDAGVDMPEDIPDEMPEEAPAGKGVKGKLPSKAPAAKPEKRDLPKKEVPVAEGAKAI